MTIKDMSPPTSDKVFPKLDFTPPKLDFTPTQIKKVVDLIFVLEMQIEDLVEVRKKILDTIKDYKRQVNDIKKQLKQPEQHITPPRSPQPAEPPPEPPPEPQVIGEAVKVRKKNYAVSFCCGEREAGEVMEVLHTAFHDFNFKLEEK